MAPAVHVFTLVFLSCICMGVTQGAATPATQPSPAVSQPVKQSKSHGDVRLMLETDRQTMGIADHLRLTLSVHTPLHTVVAFPQPAEALGAFRMVSHKLLEPRPITPQTQQWQQEYTLEATTAGALTIPPLTITFQSPDAQTPQHLSSDALSIRVTTVLPEDAEVTAPKDIAPPLALPRRGLPTWLWVLSGGLLGLALSGGLWWWYQRRRTHVTSLPVARPAHLLALEALQRLQQDNLVAQHRFEAFYVRLSDILRRYVEWRFGLRAPEQTTDEFLAAARAAGGLLVTHRELLGAFLQHCDLVKFARHQPSPRDMQGAFESAREFVEQTADDGVVVAVPVSGGAA